MTLKISSSRRNQLISITQDVRSAIRHLVFTSGLCLIYVPHTTAGITINEDADPDVAEDIVSALDALVPHRQTFRHAEGNSDSHVKASLVGSSVTLGVDNGELDLGRWQGIFFCEFDGPRERNILMTLIG